MHQALFWAPCVFSEETFSVEVGFRVGTRGGFALKLMKHNFSGPSLASFCVCNFVFCILIKVYDYQVVYNLDLSLVGT